MPDEVVWNCRFHPTDGFHEVGCPHVEWTNDRLQEAVVNSKRSMAAITAPLIRDLWRQLAESGELAYSNQVELTQCRFDRMVMDGENRELREKLDRLERKLVEAQRSAE